MKYEITKGSEKDFEQAPEWAMQVDKCIETGHSFYTENIMGSQSGTDKCKWSNESEVRPLNFSANYEHEGFETIAQRRPITELVWDGEGLMPSVGMKCLAKQCSQINADEFLVVAIQDGAVFGFWTATGAATGLDVNRWIFLPIRSPEDVARDEAISEMVGIYFNHGIPEKQNREDYESMAALYDAGYRKME